MTECHKDYAMLNFYVKYSFMCLMTNVYGNFKMAVNPSPVFPVIATRMRSVMSGTFPVIFRSRVVCCLRFMIM